MMHRTFFDGESYDPQLDRVRLTSQLERVKALMSDGQWRSLAEIQSECGGSEASISARGRDFRKERFGSHQWDARRVAGGDGLWEYRLTLKPEQMEINLTSDTV